MKIRILVMIMAASIIMSLPICASAADPDFELFVAPDGNDRAVGSITAPLATIAGAKEKAKSLDGSVTVFFREGVYTFDDTVVFGPDDRSGVTYKSYEKERVVFTACEPVTEWEHVEINGVSALRANVGSERQIKALLNDTQTLPVSRFPESGYLYPASVSDSDLSEPGDYNDIFKPYISMTVKTEDIPQIKNSLSASVRMLHWWKDDYLPVKSYDAETGKIVFTRPSAMTIRTTDRYYLENVPEGMNEPGEWCYDVESGDIYYIPRDNETAAELSLWVSDLETFILDNGCDGLRFENIVFRGNGYTIDDTRESTQAAYEARPCISFSNAKGIRITNCEFRDLGSAGVYLGEAVSDARIENCVFENIGEQAVYIRGNNIPVDDPKVTKDIHVVNNLIHKFGRTRFNAVALLVINANSVELAHNEISDGYYSAVSVGWVWGYDYSVTYNNRICDNLIYNIGQGMLSDMGGIYTLGKQPGTVISGNIIHNVASDPGVDGYGGWGIYPDEGSSEITIENNLVYCCGSDSYHLHYGADNTVRNNIFAFSGDSQVRVVSRYEDHKTADFTNNIILTDGKTPAFSHIQDAKALTAENNIIWDISNGDELYVNGGGSNARMTYKSAKRKKLLGENIIADPGFNDPMNFDFTLKEDSPALSAGFKPWDYSEAGTISGTTLGLGTAGGGTSYNEQAEHIPYAERSTDVSSTVNYVFLGLYSVMIVILCCFGIKHKNFKLLIQAGVLLACAAMSFAVRSLFINWAPLPYTCCETVFCLFAAVPFILLRSGPFDKKKTVIRYVIGFGVVDLVFFLTALLLNNIINIGNSVAITITLALSAIYLIAASFLLLNKEIKKRRANAEPA
ncbi:MAG: right-handed parallel beta-helix repeat-containing protein [Clostridia bacterium]|nr:right-handed parallel beta-helix repeat-containing protein [Clostridia bacterium]